MGKIQCDNCRGYYRIGELHECIKGKLLYPKNYYISDIALQIICNKIETMVENEKMKKNMKG